MTARLLALLLAAACAAAPTREGLAPRLVVEPAAGLVDAPVRVRAEGLAPGTEAVLRAAVRTEPARGFVAWGRFGAGADGAIDTARDAPLDGTWSGADPMGLFWSMTPESLPAGVGGEPAPFAPPAPYAVAIDLVVEGRLVASATAERRFVGSGVRVEELGGDGLVGRLFLPAGGGRPPVVVVLSGSEGGLESSSVDAALLASHGFAALALAYFRAEGLPDELFSIPLETVTRAIDRLAARDDVDAARVALMGGSKGAELALLAASSFPDRVDAVVAYAPGSVVRPGITRGGASREESSWTLAGEEVPYLAHVASPEFLAQFERPEPVRLRLLSEASLADSAAAERFAIPVERIRGPLLLISGEDDQMGPSSSEAARILARRARAGLPFADRHLSYAGAGHVILVPYLPTPPRVAGGRFAVGGTAAGYARADRDSWPRVLEFLRESLDH